MTTHNRILTTAARGRRRTLSSSDWTGALADTVTWADTCADYYAAVAMYEQLSALSDAELTRRGLSRATLAHDVRATCDRSSKP
jgi:hypothetical protein